MSQHHGATKPAQKRMMGIGGRRASAAARAAEKDGRDSALPNVRRRRTNVSDVPLPLRLPPSARGRGRACACACCAPLPELLPVLPLGGVVVNGSLLFSLSESV